MAYRINLDKRLHVHDVFHVSLLKPYQEDGTTQPPKATINVEGELEWEVKKILLHKERKKMTEYYVKWTGYGPEHCTWEPESNLTNCQDAVQEYWDSVNKSHKAKLKSQAKTKGK